ncbi:tripartite motif-containing protein 16-like [Genypterus blacodes]|uniref:tripartite motif-containing protein 16-like n=1 Tax=Genypterus blacodes TaxID=154954 RepID=UPI003F757DE3
MAQGGIQLGQDKIKCSICLDIFSVPVTIPCGHSYCMSCINGFWNRGTPYSCPECRKTFTPRPFLVKNNILADIVEELKKTEPQAVKLQKNICPRHNEVMKMFCRTDQQCICVSCFVDEHKGHNTVLAAAEVNERQRMIQQRIHDTEKVMKVLQQEVEFINFSADKAVRDRGEIFRQCIALLEIRSSEVKEQIRSQQKTEVSRVAELHEKLEQEIAGLRRKDVELQQLSHEDADPIRFLQNYPSRSHLSNHKNSTNVNIRPLRYFEDVTAALSEVRDQLQNILREEGTKISQTVTDVDVLLIPAEPKNRDEFLKYSRQIKLDPTTSHYHLVLSKDNRKATKVTQYELCNLNVDRFDERWQVLSQESLTRHCYFEVEWSVNETGIAVAYRNISRTGPTQRFGYCDKSWTLMCNKSGYTFMHNNVTTPLSDAPSSRVGVYLDRSAGILSFYSVSETMTLLHRVQVTFTQPLYAGLALPKGRGYAMFCEL